MKLSLLALVATANAFPSFDMFHANCQINVKVTNQDCTVAMQSLGKALDVGSNEMASPPGFYKIKSTTSNMVWAERTTANKKYVDDVMFQIVGSDNGKCDIVGKSRSQSVSYYDYNVNFCNMYNGLRIAQRDSGLEFGDISNSKCSYGLTASDYKTCDRY